MRSSVRSLAIALALLLLLNLVPPLRRAHADNAPPPAAPSGAFVWPDWARTARIAGLALQPTDGEAAIAPAMDNLAAQQVSVVLADSPWGSSYGDWVDDAKFQVVADYMGKAVQAAHARGLKVVVYTSGLEMIAPPERNPAREHPDWAQRSLDGRSTLWNDVSNAQEHWLQSGEWDLWASPCHGLRDLSLARMRDIAGLGVDGLWVDTVYLQHSMGSHTDLWPSTDPCSAAAFRRATGLGLPQQEDWSDPVWRRWILWRHSQLTDFLVALQQAAHAVNPALPFFEENWDADTGGSTYYGNDPAAYLPLAGISTGHELGTVGDRLDRGDTGMLAATLEQWLAFRTEVAFARAADRGKPSWVLTYGNHPRDSTQLAGLVLAEGANFYETRGPGMAASVGPAHRQRLFRWVAAQQSDLYGTQSAARVGLVYSPLNRDLVDQGGGEPYSTGGTVHFAAYRAAAAALYRAHVPFDVVLDTDLTAFDHYQTLILPEVRAMGDATAAALQRYSGRLLALGEAGSLDADLNPRTARLNPQRLAAAGDLPAAAADPILATDAPASLQLSLRHGAAGYALVLDNLDAAPAAGFGIDLRLQEHEVLTEAHLSAPDGTDAAIPFSTPYDSNTVHLTVPAGIDALALITLRTSTAAGGDAVTVRVDAATAANRFSPLRALGSGVDSLPSAPSDGLLSDAIVAQILTAGHGALSYRLYTELSDQAWHWNPAGSWSDAAGQQGYFTGTATSGDRIVHSYGYSLAHRGNTTDQGNNAGYSRLTDGDPTSYWKSNPYLTQAYTGEADALHPQWVVVDLGKAQPVNAVSLAWADPFATAYTVQSWTGDDAIASPAGGTWQTFPGGTVTDGTGGTVVLQLADAPVATRFLRVLMTASSGTCDSHGAADRRNCLGYAMSEIGVGTSDGTNFTDLVVHSLKTGEQTRTYVSSVDPWHQATAQVSGDEQPGLDRVLGGALTRGLPAMVPVAMLYGTPEDAVAELTYLKAAGYPVTQVELGEEPDGQYALPEDYGALFVQWAKALHAAFPDLVLGGPVLQEGVQQVQTWPDAAGQAGWLNRFLAYLRTHGALDQLGFFSAEHYPFRCNEGWAALRQEPEAIRQVMSGWRAAGLPPNLPIYITEYNFSAEGTDVMQDIPGALWQADFVGSFLAAGGAGAYYYQALPLGMHGGGDGCRPGTFAMFTTDEQGGVRQATAQFYASQLINLQWAQPVDALHTLHPAVTGSDSVTAYALERPDGQWAVLLINKDPDRPQTVSVSFGGARFAGLVTQVSFGRDNYDWDGEPHLHSAPVAQTFPAPVSFTLPRGSISVLRGSLGTA